MRRNIQNLPEPYASLFKAVLADCPAEVIGVFVQNGADLGYKDPNTGSTLLRAATLSSRVKAVTGLLQHGADPNQKFTYRSPSDWRTDTDRAALHYATAPEVAEALIKAGADVNAVDAEGTTPLMCAAFRGPPAVVRLLLAAGASPTIRQAKRRGKKAMTARELAESKLEFWRDAVDDSNRAAAERRAKCYEEIRDILIEAELKVPNN